MTMQLNEMINPMQKIITKINYSKLCNAILTEFALEFTLIDFIESNNFVDHIVHLFDDCIAEICPSSYLIFVYLLMHDFSTCPVLNPFLIRAIKRYLADTVESYLIDANCLLTDNEKQFFDYMLQNYSVDPPQLPPLFDSNKHNRNDYL